MLGFTLPTREVGARSSMEERLLLAYQVFSIFLGYGAYWDIEYTRIRFPVVNLINSMDN